MLHTVNTLAGYTLLSLDGEIGKAREFYFDDHHWAVRYLVADTGNWLTGRQVLLSPRALTAIRADTKQIVVNLTKKQIEDSPKLSSDRPVSHQFEREYHGYYAWPLYWCGPSMWGAYPFPYLPVPYPVEGGVAAPVAAPATPPEDEKHWDPHLRSTHTVTGYHIEARDGELGHLEDFVIDDADWAIRYLVVDTRNWWPGKRVLMSPAWIDRVSWEVSKVFVNMSRDAIRNAPEYTDASSLSRAYEADLHAHYKQAPYWSKGPGETPA